VSDKQLRWVRGFVWYLCLLVEPARDPLVPVSVGVQRLELLAHDFAAAEQAALALGARKERRAAVVRVLRVLRKMEGEEAEELLILLRGRQVGELAVGVPV
jgi:hypothetical protein